MEAKAGVCERRGFICKERKKEVVEIEDFMEDELGRIVGSFIM